jgi:hypothetical protein
MKAVIHLYLRTRLFRYGQDYTRNVIRAESLGKRQYLIGPYYAGSNLTPAPLTPASKILFPPFKAGVKRAAKGIIVIFKDLSFNSYNNSERQRSTFICA